VAGLAPPAEGRPPRRRPRRLRIRHPRHLQATTTR